MQDKTKSQTESIRYTSTKSKKSEHASVYTGQYTEAQHTAQSAIERNVDV